jgi:hypothetical protein
MASPGHACAGASSGTAAAIRFSREVWDLFTEDERRGLLAEFEARLAERRGAASPSAVQGGEAV